MGVAEVSAGDDEDGGGDADPYSHASATRLLVLSNVVEGAKVRGFTAESLYLDDADKPIGARFKHDATGFTFDYLRIEMAPQGFIWVNSFPTSDKLDVVKQHF